MEHRTAHTPGVPLPEFSPHAPSLLPIPRSQEPTASIGTNTDDTLLETRTKSASTSSLRRKSVKRAPPVKDSGSSNSLESEVPEQPVRKRKKPARLVQPDNKQRYHNTSGHPSSRSPPKADAVKSEKMAQIDPARSPRAPRGHRHQRRLRNQVACASLQYE